MVRWEHGFRVTVCLRKTKEPANSTSIQVCCLQAHAVCGKEESPLKRAQSRKREQHDQLIRFMNFEYRVKTMLRVLVLNALLSIIALTLAVFVMFALVLLLGGY